MMATRADEPITVLPDRAVRSSGRNEARARNPARSASAQLSLFDIATGEDTNLDTSAPLAPPPQSVTQSNARPAQRRHGARAIDQRPSRVLSVDDMPAYSEDAHEGVAAALQQLPHAQLWFTYKDIQFFFGVSRATVARRLRDGLVPGVRMAGASVVEDAPVRRFDRGQLKWLLLALRHRQRQRAP
jgi:hypothetical protein